MVDVVFSPRVDQMRRRAQRAAEEGIGSSAAGEHYETGDFTPPVDVIEQAESLLVRAELPGVAREDIEVNVENGTLFLAGSKRPDKNVPGEAYRRNERAYGRFARSFILPRDVDPAKIAATLRDGVLEIALPKMAGAVPRRVKIG